MNLWMSKMIYQKLKFAALLALIVIMSSACSTISRYDKDGNEVVFIMDIDDSRLTKASPSGGSINEGAVLGRAITSSSLSAASTGILGGGLIAGIYTSIRDKGKIEVFITDYDHVLEEKPTPIGRAHKQTSEPWEGCDQLRKGTWAKIIRNGGDFKLIACSPECNAVPDTTGKFKPKKGIVRTRTLNKIVPKGTSTPNDTGEISSDVPDQVRPPPTVSVVQQ